MIIGSFLIPPLIWWHYKVLSSDCRRPIAYNKIAWVRKKLRAQAVGSYPRRAPCG
ncbi:hypothetical protein CLOSTASPAR_05888 [[Clostridium] asparagiforme DSM 15981]|uniref:Uncharacterized protein n=1 Tax=[Clostridium] asparagiforme DSM 15981 TaxID=518636 RepID=C0D9D7_9FIRM|nr:hypothetical protein CLOSTASPAR_05888 [[Clostridium] asparagiforme DSM 15981]